MLECVVNVSEGRNRAVIDALATVCGPALLDVHSDFDHHRSVFTIAAAEASEVQRCVRALARASVARLDVRSHAGVHPRIGVIDVVPFVGLDATGAHQAVAEARNAAQFLGDDLGVPVFLYGEADPARRTLPALRASAFRDRRPDMGPATPHPSAGACAVGVRPPLVAVNFELAAADLATARTVAGAVRERDGGLVGVRALGFWLESRRRAQVSLNLIDLGATGLEAAWAAVEGEARRHATNVAAIELVGLVPAAEFERCSATFAARVGLTPEQTIEGRVATRWR